MNTNDLSPKQRTVIDLTLMIHITSTDQVPTMTLGEQIKYIELNSEDLTKKAIDSQLRSLAKKGWLEKNALGMFELTDEAMTALTNDRQPTICTCAADLLGNSWHVDCPLAETVVAEYTVDDPSVRHDVDKADKAITEKVARITAHTNCSHDTSKAARAKCRRQRRNAS